MQFWINFTAISKLRNSDEIMFDGFSNIFVVNVVSFHFNNFKFRQTLCQLSNCYVINCQLSLKFVNERKFDLKPYFLFWDIYYDI